MTWRWWPAGPDCSGPAGYRSDVFDGRRLAAGQVDAQLLRGPEDLVEVLSSDGNAIELRDTDDEVFRAAEELGIDLSRREPSSVEDV